MSEQDPKWQRVNSDTSRVKVVSGWIHYFDDWAVFVPAVHDMTQPPGARASNEDGS